MKNRELQTVLGKMGEREEERHPVDLVVPKISLRDALIRQRRENGQFVGAEDETEPGQEEREKRERLTVVAKNIIDCFDFQPGKESFLVIVDDKVILENGSFVEAIREELEKRTGKDQRTKGASFEFVIIPASKKSATPFGDAIGDKLRDRPVLIITSMSRSHSKEVGAALRYEDHNTVFNSLASRKLAEAGVESPDSLEEEERKKFDEYDRKMREYIASQKGVRLISITKGHNPYEILTRGAVEESVEVLRERAEKVNELMADVEEVHITTPMGTNLILRPRHDKSEIEDGRIDKPGKVANYPIGEWSCSPFQEGANGILVVDGPIGGNHNLDMVKEHGPLRLELKDGVVVKINDMDLAGVISKLDAGGTTGNPLVDSVVKYLHEGQNDAYAFRLAELGVGTNSKACEGKPDEWIGSSEGEKIYRTIHIAFGSNGTFGVEKDDPNFNVCNIHCDNVIGVQTPITVECTKKDGTKFNLIENGKPIDY